MALICAVGQRSTPRTRFPFGFFPPSFHLAFVVFLLRKFMARVVNVHVKGRVAQTKGCARWGRMNVASGSCDSVKYHTHTGLLYVRCVQRPACRSRTSSGTFKGSARAPSGSYASSWGRADAGVYSRAFTFHAFFPGVRISNMSFWRRTCWKGKHRRGKEKPTNKPNRTKRHVHVRPKSTSEFPRAHVSDDRTRNPGVTNAHHDAE